MVSYPEETIPIFTHYGDITWKGRIEYKKIFCLIVLIIELVLLSFSPAQAKFPERPINIVVYLKPGGAGDIFARRFEKIAAKYTDAKFVVMNKPGAGGLTAMTYIVSGKPDGYNLAYVTKSNIAQFAEATAKIKIDDLDWLAMLVSDPESLIVRRDSPIRTLDQELHFPVKWVIMDHSYPARGRRFQWRYPFPNFFSTGKTTNSSPWSRRS